MGAAEECMPEFAAQASKRASEIAKEEIEEHKGRVLLGKFNGVYEDFAQGVVANRKGKMARERVIDLARPCIQIAEDLRKENQDQGRTFDEFIACLKERVRRAI